MFAGYYLDYQVTLKLQTKIRRNLYRKSVPGSKVEEGL